MRKVILFQQLANTVELSTGKHTTEFIHVRLTPVTMVQSAANPQKQLQGKRGKAGTDRFLNVVIVLAWILIVLVIVEKGYMKHMSDNLSTLTSQYMRAVNDEGGDFALGIRDSDGFFTDIPRDHWIRLRDRFRRRVSHACSTIPGGCPDYVEHFSKPRMWYQDNWEPQFSCLHERRIGRLGDGGKWVCDPHRVANKGKDCLVYSVGSNGDFSFEEHIFKDISPHCEIHTFDMSPKYASMAPDGVKYHAWGLSDETRREFKSFEDTIKELGHVGRTIDIFKIDCEGCEWKTFEAWLNPIVTLRQILVELHNSPADSTDNLFEKLEAAGYVAFHKEPNIKYLFGPTNIAVEYAFLKLGSTFFQID